MDGQRKRHASLRKSLWKSKGWDKRQESGVESKGRGQGEGHRAKFGSKGPGWWVQRMTESRETAKDAPREDTVIFEVLMKERKAAGRKKKLHVPIPRGEQLANQ